MADEATTTDQPSGTVWDAPNQQVVRPDESGPWVEGEGGTVEPTPKDAAAGSSGDLDQMTKDQLLAYAQQLGISPANASMTKDELRAAVDAHLAGG